MLPLPFVPLAADPARDGAGIVPTDGLLGVIAAEAASAGGEAVPSFWESNALVKGGIPEATTGPASVADGFCRGEDVPDGEGEWLARLARFAFVVVRNLDLPARQRLVQCEQS